MPTDMDPRLEHRRRRVAEDRARSNLGRLVRLLMVVAVAAAGFWFVQSPFLSVSEVTVTGASRVDVKASLARNDIVVGRPMVLLDVEAARSTLMQDPWVAQAEVGRDWPTSVVVAITERVPAASVLLGGEWWLAAADGVLLTRAAGAEPSLGIARFDNLAEEEGRANLDVEGAVAFLAALPAHYRSESVVSPGADGLEAVVAGFTIRLGRPFDMEAKADVTAAILDDGLEEGAIVTVVAPASPAVLPPAPGGGGEETTSTTEASSSP